MTQARSELKEIQNQDLQKQDESLHHRLKEAEDKAEDSENPEAAQLAAKAIEAIIWSECTQACYDRIKQVVKKYTSGGLDRLEVPSRKLHTLDSQGGNLPPPGSEFDDTWEILLGIEEIHEALLEHNKKHFHQAAETPFGHGLLQDLVGFLGLTQGANAIVEGTFLEEYENLDLLPETRQLIAEMAMPEVFKADPQNTVSVKIEWQDFVDGFK